ncbi:hypothetical protein BpHYR1_050472 [Brachionus plicatilis]|uniref:Uncharacterized protein n=1 Tax=Brachionus plicatilis TaxID=10195 RepID=A0A3M7RPH0_BRAPC|nr:hypothetical protein BpHYR1_050472 [Brachionus plicatilis]
MLKIELNVYLLIFIKKLYNEVLTSANQALAPSRVITGSISVSSSSAIYLCLSVSISKNPEQSPSHKKDFLKGPFRCYFTKLEQTNTKKEIMLPESDLFQEDHQKFLSHIFMEYIFFIIYKNCDIFVENINSINVEKN